MGIRTKSRMPARHETAASHSTAQHRLAKEEEQGMKEGHQTNEGSVSKAGLDLEVRFVFRKELSLVRGV